MKTLLRAGVLVAVATGFCVALSMSASADVVEPRSATQPAAVGLLEQETAKAMVPQGVPDGKPAAEPVAEAKQEELSEVAEPTPAPEQVVRQAPALTVQADTNTPMSNRAPTSVVDRVMHPLRMGFQHVGASLGRAVGACAVGFGTGSGGPVLLFAVIAMVAPFIRHRVFSTRWAADEDVPEFLFARELTPPG